MRFLGAIIAGLFAAGTAEPSRAQPSRAQPNGAPAPAVDYAAAESWLCRPGRRDACTTDLRSTVIDARGRRRTEAFRADSTPPVDCFYVYPTVSAAPGLSAPIRVTEAERRAARLQVARFASVCRIFAPLYRQLTVDVLLRSEDGQQVQGVPAAINTVERDIAAAWRHYLQHDNRGRGVVLIGHSQGANALLALIRTEIDAKPIQAQLVSAILPGIFVEVPKGRDVGGTFRTVPGCRSASQTGCVIAFDSWRAERPPSPTHRPDFEAGMELLCTNPAALAGGAGPLQPHLSATGETILPAVTTPAGSWTRPPSKIDTPFVQLPGLLWAECVDNPRGDHLAVSVRPAPGDVRTGLIAGDWVRGGRIGDWGLHLIDLELAAGDLIDIVRRQALEHGRKRPAARPAKSPDAGF